MRCVPRVQLSSALSVLGHEISRRPFFFIPPTTWKHKLSKLLWCYVFGERSEVLELYFPVACQMLFDGLIKYGDRKGRGACLIL